MVELLDNPDVLTRRRLDPGMLQLAGVRYGSSARTILRGRIVHADSRVVHRSVRGTDVDSEFYDENGRRLSLDEVVDSVFQADGVLHYDSRVSFTVRGGTVVGFAIYGDNLSHFAYLLSYRQFLAEFGEPDRVEIVEDHHEGGGPTGYYNYYWDSRKCAHWDNWDDRLSFVNIGDYAGNRRP